MCRVTGDQATMEKHLESLKLFMGQLARVRFLREEFQDEVKRLALITALTEDMGESEIKECESALHDVTNNKAGVFYKALTMLPTGMRVIGRASVFFEQLAKDRTFEIELTSLQAHCESLKTVHDSACLRNGRLHMPASELWAELNTRLANVTANTSAKFKSAHKEVLEKIQSRQVEASDALAKALSIRFQLVFSKFVESALQLQEASNQELITVLRSLLQDARSACEIQDGVNLAKLFPNALVSKVSGVRDGLVQLVEAYLQGLDILVAVRLNAQVDLTSESTIAFMAALGQHQTTADELSDTRCGELHKFLLNYLHKAATDSLAAQVAPFVPFILQLSDKQATPEMVFEAAPDVQDLPLAQLIAFSRLIAKKYVNVLGGDMCLTVSENKTQPVPSHLVCIAPQLLQFAQLICKLNKWRADASLTFKDLGQTLRPLMLAFEVGAAAAKELSEGLPDERLKTTVEFGISTSVNFIHFAIATFQAACESNVKDIIASMQCPELANLSQVIEACEDFNGAKRDELMNFTRLEATDALYNGFKTHEALIAQMGKALHDYRALASRFPEHAYNIELRVQGAEGVFKEKDSDLKKAGRVLGNLTIIQALLRELNPGETRKQLCRKGVKSIAKKGYMSVDVKLNVALNNVLGNSGVE